MTLDGGPAAGRRVGDRDRLLQVVGNLLDNALKFTPAGGHVDLTVAPGRRRASRPARWPAPSAPLARSP